MTPSDILFAIDRAYHISAVRDLAFFFIATTLLIVSYHKGR